MRIPALAVIFCAVAGCSTSRATASATAGSSPGGFLFFDAGGFQCPDASLADAGAPACTPTRSVSYRADVVPIFAAHCNGENCHNGTWGGSGAYENLVSRPSHECCGRRLLVAPGDPERSYLLDKLGGHDLCGGRRMPLGRTIPAADIQTIADWVCEGAPRN